MKSLIKAKQKGEFSTVDSLELPLNLIDEDPNQPRTEFDPVTLQELADTIRLRGVKTPISVHPSTETKGRFIINHGARRYRASKLAGKETIPAFIDADYTQADQIIENLQRDNLTPREIADFIGRELSRGRKKYEIAQLIGKSQAFITQHVTLLDLPPLISRLYNSGRTQDVTTITEVVKAYKQNPEEITAWLADENQEITRSTIKLMRECLIDEQKDTPASAKANVDPAPAESAVAKTQIINNTPKETPGNSAYKNENRLKSLVDQFVDHIKLQVNPEITLSQLSSSEQQQLETLLLKLIRTGNSNRKSKIK